MFGELSSSLSELDEVSRTRLAKLLADRSDYFAQLIKLNGLRVAMLQNPSPANEAAVKDFNSTVVAPLRSGMNQDVQELVESCFDLEGLKQLMPIILMGLLQSINWPLLLTTVGLEPDRIDEFVAVVSKFIKSGM